MPAVPETRRKRGVRAMEESIRDKLKHWLEHGMIFLKWVACALLMGLVLGAAGTLFHYCVDGANRYSGQYPYLIWFLPLGGLLIMFLYKITKMERDQGTDLVIRSVRSTEPISIKTAPLIFVSTVLTHLLGGSAGREGAALQLGGSMAAQVGRWFRFDEKDERIMVMCGMSAAFSALFGAPLTAAVFSLEVISVGVMYYSALVPCVLSAVVGCGVAVYFGVIPVRFHLTGIPEMGALPLGKVILLAALCAVLSVVFCLVMHLSGKAYGRLLKNRYLRILAGGLLVIGLTYLFQTRDYNGAGMEVIRRAIDGGEARPEAFALKLALTAVTLGAGYRGGEIVPAFFVGATFGCVMGPLIGLDPSFAAGIGLIALFCGVVNCPLTSLLLGVELFGAEGILYYAVAAAVSYMLSGYHGLYRGQKILYSKTEPTFINTSST